MAFDGPTARDFANVYSLNATLLDVLATTPGALRIPATLSARVQALETTQRARLAHTPVLLLSVAEDDLGRWAAISNMRLRRDLVSEMQRPDARLAELIAATLGFLWQLACRDVYAARVVSGGSSEWCETLADALLVDVLEFGACEPGLPALRLADHGPFWDKLLDAGTSDIREVRMAARLCAMQTVLTGSARLHGRPLRSAACTMSQTSMVAERQPRTRRR